MAAVDFGIISVIWSLQSADHISKQRDSNAGLAPLWIIFSLQVLHWFETLHSECDKLGWWVSSQNQISETIGSEIRKSWRERQSRSRGQQEEIPSGAAVKELIPRNPDYLLTYRPTISRDGLAFVKLGKVLFEHGETVQSSELNSTNRLKAGWSNDIIKIARPWFAAMFDDR